MKRALLALIAVTSAAHAQPARKSKPDKFSRAAGEAFKRAVEAEEQGNPELAARNYETSLQLVIHPNTVFNLAAAREKAGYIEAAIVDYETYLVLAPTASDAPSVRAKITALEKMGGTATLVVREGIDPSEAYVLIDGDIIKKPGDMKRKSPREAYSFDLPLTAGRHSVEFITVLGYSREDLEIKRGKKVKQELFDQSQNGANVIISADHDFTFAGQTGWRRFKVPPGKQLMGLFDDERECPAITVDAPSNDNVAYIHIRRLEPRGRHPSHAVRCRKHQVIQRTLTFE